MRILSYLFSIKGRATRTHLWLAAISFTAIVLLFKAADASQVTESLIGLPLFYSTLAISVRRLHDRDKSGWWVLLSCFPVIGQIWIVVELGFLTGSNGENRFGTDPRQKSLESIPNDTEIDTEDVGGINNIDEFSEKLRILRNLKEEGLITEEEHQQKRKGIIDKL